MYLPPSFREEDPAVLHNAIRAHPLATMITAGQSGLIANVLPFRLYSNPDGNVLRAHLSKASDQLNDLKEDTPAIVLFQGPQVCKPQHSCCSRLHLASFK